MFKDKGLILLFIVTLLAMAFVIFYCNSVESHNQSDKVNGGCNYAQTQE